jgi:putative chitinase
MTPLQLQAATSCTLANAGKYCAPLDAAMVRYGINTRIRQAHFLGQIGVESAHLAAVVENLNYRAETLMRVWPARFPTMALAQQYAGSPEKLANQVYGNRMGNGAPETGDGFKYRGRGLKQLTGKFNYQTYQTDSGRPVIEAPDLLLTPDVAADSAGWFWWKHNLNTLADQADVGQITRVVNGGTNGLLERTRLTQLALEQLA